MVDRVRLSKALSYWLRHAPEAGGLTLTSDGWADTELVLNALCASGMNVDSAKLKDVIAESDKQRFELSKTGDRIRARQGHSVEVVAGWERAIPPARLYHGTVAPFLDAILREGLLPQARHHVHLSLDVDTARTVGQRRGEPIVLEVAAGALADAGGYFYLSSNGVWLVAQVPPAYLSSLSAD